MSRGRAARRAGRVGGGSRRRHEWRLHGCDGGQSRCVEVRVRRGDEGNDAPTWARGWAQLQAFPQRMGCPENGPVTRGAHGTQRDHCLSALPRPAHPGPCGARLAPLFLPSLHRPYRPPPSWPARCLLPAATRARPSPPPRAADALRIPLGDPVPTLAEDQGVLVTGDSSSSVSSITADWPLPFPAPAWLPGRPASIQRGYLVLPPVTGRRVRSASTDPHDCSRHRQAIAAPQGNGRRRSTPSPATPTTARQRWSPRGAWRHRRSRPAAGGTQGPRVPGTLGRPAPRAPRARLDAGRRLVRPGTDPGDVRHMATALQPSPG